MALRIHGSAHDHAFAAGLLGVILAEKGTTAARLLGVWRSGRVV
jgi:hypothetical protein